jgi:N-acetylneuraminic acid mutarotase
VFVRHILLAGLTLFGIGTVVAAAPPQRTLSFEDRVKAQEAIERVYYSHQIGTTQPFEQAVPRAVLEDKVRKYLDETAALERYWKTAITDLMLDREIERMTQGTRMPERLTELYSALGNDAFLIKETLARATLVDRLVRNFYAFDPSMHVEERKTAEELHRKLVSAELRPSEPHAERSVIEIAVAANRDATASTRQLLSPEEFRAQRARFPASVGEIPPMRETRDGFVTDVVLHDGGDSATVAHYETAKASWESWWERATERVSAVSVPSVAVDRAWHAPASVHSTKHPASCSGDLWDNRTLDDVPEAHASHSAVWTGTLMLIWGGSNLNTGWRYDPSTDTWTPMTTAGAPQGRYAAAAVWTGSEMVVWGGWYWYFNSYGLNTGGRYDPMSDTWTPTSLSGAPAPRDGPAVVWSGSEMVVWGGSAHLPGQNIPTYFNDGACYDPATDTWRPTTIVGAPAGRSGAAAVWIGTSMWIWGGRDTTYTEVNDGARYDPANDAWTPISSIGAPASRGSAQCVWTGSTVIVWGGSHVTQAMDTGGLYDPASDTWSPMSTLGAPASRQVATAVWTGHVMVVWGGGSMSVALNTGGRYDPVANLWTPTSLDGAPGPRESHSAVWTGSSMIVWGGWGFSLGAYASGGRYDPVSDTWTPTSLGAVGSPAPRFGHTAVWTGTKAVIWGGSGNGVRLISGGSYDPATDSWTATALSGAPTGRSDFTAVWTGTRMIVWGGSSEVAYHEQTGGRYDPITDTWTPTSLVNAAGARFGHGAAWAGGAMTVWGGRGYDIYGNEAALLRTGGRYNPTTDTWAPTSLINAPPEAENFVTLAAGARVMFWGGGYYHVGSMYDPQTDQWRTMSTAGSAYPYGGATAVWTGHQAIVWGGDVSYGATVGAAYDPGTDVWHPISTVNAPTQRHWHSAVWTGRHMVVWGGGYGGEFEVDTGGRYDPVTDRWTPTSVEGAPPARERHTAVWTGSFMFVWGGLLGEGGYPSAGGRYYAEGAPDDDCDGDGFTGAQGDCDDTNASVYPGAPEVCDGFNDDCSDPAWPAIRPEERNPDGDPYLICQGDCDETDPTVYPGAPQLCDGVNNDCNDLSWPAVPADELDSDGDGYMTCAGDCDDTRAFVHPGAPEICDGIDDNCNTLVDDWNLGLCDDHNICTDDVCNGGAGCSWTPRDRPCNDGDACTTADACVDGVCVGGPPLECADDSDVCNGVRYCSHLYGCVTSSPLYCNDGDPCDGTESCDPVRGCVSGPPPACDDGNACNGVETCVQWYGCVPGMPPQCDDQNSCTSDVCDRSVGCVHTPRTGPCDGACFAGGVCQAGTCVGTPLDCDDQNPCTLDSCSPSTGCRHVPLIGTACDDGSVCTAGDYCLWGQCVGDALDCDDHNLCTTDFCHPVFGCVHDPAPGLSCDDGNPCTEDGCDPSRGCVFSPLVAGTPCDDFFTCTTSDHCDGGGNCGGGSVCDDGNTCTEDFADEYDHCACSHAPIYSGTECSDGNACTAGDVCDGMGACVGGTAVSCDDGDACTQDSCGAQSGCVHTAQSCDDGNPCTDDSCNPATGCVHVNNTAPCNGGNACTSGDTCSGGVCNPGGPTNCDDGNCCTIDSCNPATGCVHAANIGAPTFTVQPSLGACPVLWPPNHGYADFTVADTGAAATSACGIASIQFASCSSSQLENGTGTGDGNTTRDCVYEAGAVHMRAERDGACSPIGRVYETTLVAIDVCGNVAISSPIAVGVYHDRSNAPPIGTTYSASGDGYDTPNGTNGTYGLGCGAGSPCVNGTTHDHSDADPEMEVLQDAAVSVGDLRLGKAGGGNVQLTWSDPTLLSATHVTRYHVYRQGPLTLFWTMIAEVPKQSLSYQDPSLNDGSNWQYKVTAVIK